MIETKILLVNPPITLYKTDATGPNPPLGIAYIAAFLEKNGFEVKILDALAEGIHNRKERGDFVTIGLSDEKIERYISSFQPDVVMISSQYTAYAKDAHNIAKISKKVNSNCLVVFGGAHASANPELVLVDKNVDIVVKGEGELTSFEFFS